MPNIQTRNAVDCGTTKCQRVHGRGHDGVVKFSMKRLPSTRTNNNNHCCHCFHGYVFDIDTIHSQLAAHHLMVLGKDVCLAEQSMHLDAIRIYHMWSAFSLRAFQALLDCYSIHMNRWVANATWVLPLKHLFISLCVICHHIDYHAKYILRLSMWFWCIL